MHLEVLTDKGKELFPFLQKFKNFYLAGGTALALQIGHRVSVDFDLFTAQPLEANLRSFLEKIFKQEQILPLVNTKDQLTCMVSQVKITFLYYPFPVVHKLLKLEGQHLLDVHELAATKAYTIGRRGTFKDYIDLYFVLHEKHVSLTDIFELAEQKYKESFNARLFLEQLVYLDDILDTDINFLKAPVSKAEVQQFFENTIKSLKI
jgi:hypothetical protein